MTKKTTKKPEAPKKRGRPKLPDSQAGSDAIRARREKARQLEMSRAGDVRREESQGAYLAAAMQLWGDPARAAKALGLRFAGPEAAERVHAIAAQLSARAEGLSTDDLHRVFLLTTGAILTDLLAAHAMGAVPQRELTNSLLRLQLSRKNLLPEKQAGSLKPAELVMRVVPDADHSEPASS